MPSSPVNDRQPARRRRLLLAGLLAVVSVVSMSALTATTASALTSVSPTTDPSNGFPSWYEDAGGTRLVPCLDPADANCVLAGFTSTGPVSFPTNFPDEFFYSVVDSERITTNGCSGTKRGTAFVRLALEGTFLNGVPTATDRMTFGRIRIRVTSGLCANTDYQFAHPFGTTTLRTDSSGAIPSNVGTVDIGCTPTATVPCDFGLATDSPIFGSAGTPGSGFLRWDPAVAPAAPPGYLGDAVTPHRIVGGTSTNEFRILTAAGGRVGNGLSTNLFTVSGKLAASLAAAPSSLDFGGLELGTTTTRTVTVSNPSSDTLTLGAATTSGVDFGLAGGTCTAGSALARDDSCTVEVSFSPTGTAGDRTGTLTLPSTGGVGSPLTIALQGTAIEATQAPEIALSDSAVAFGNVRVREASPVRTVTVTNSGDAPLQVTEGVLDPAAPEQNASFRLVGDTCATGAFVPPGGTCTVDLQFAPLTNGDHTTQFQLASNAGLATVDLTGTGTGGTAAVGAVGAYGFPEWYLDDEGVRLGQCIDPDDPNCVVLGDDFYDPAQPLAFPDNFPSEYFYYMVDGLADAQDPTCNAQPGSVGMRIAVEAAFANGGPVDGDQMTFGRIRFRSSGGLCPDTDYLFVGPYGADQYRTDETGTLKPNAGTQDVGCVPAPGTPCDFAEALSSRVLSGFVRWDTGAPAGYLGDGVTPHAIVGAPYSPDGVTPANYFAVVRADSGLEVAHTDQIAVMGRLQGPLEADPSALVFGSVPTGDSATLPFTLTDTGLSELTVQTLSVAGAAAGDFTLDAGTCAGAVLQPAAGCSGTVTFTPTATGTRRARVEVVHTGQNSPVTIVLEGVGASSAATFNADPGTVDLGSVHVDGTSQVETITVSNVGGNASLQVSAVELQGPDAGEFAVTDNRCTLDVAPDGTCEVDVVFRPTSAGDKAASVVFTDNADGSPHAVGLVARGSATGPAASALLDPGNGFPAYYVDATGARVAPCLDPDDPLCVLAGFTPTGPVAFPDNFPDEFFYSLADSDTVSVAPVAGCDVTTAGTATLRVALEGSFANLAPVAGDQITFGRTRVKATGLCADTEYTFVTPYGPVALTSDADGAITAKAGTTDIGDVSPFDGALAAPIVGGFPRWNPNVAPAAPAGHLGDPRVLHTIVGGTYVPPGAAGAFNGFEVSSAGTRLGGTDKFLVSGLTGTGILADVSSLDFGNVDVGAQSGQQVVTVTNIGSATTLSTVAITGADANQFVLDGSGTCSAGETLASDASCTVSVAFVPTSAGTKTAQLSVTDDSGATSAVSLAGIGNEVGAPIASVSPSSLDFGSQPVGSATAPQPITVANTGTVDLTMGTVAIAGPAAGDYAHTTTCTGTLQPGTSCTISVVLTPSAAGARSATLSFTHDAAASPSSVSLTGTGVASTFSVTPTTVKFGKVNVTTTKTGSVTVRNTGSIPFTPTRAEVTGPGATAFTVQPSSACLGVPLAPGRTCSVLVDFRPTARTGYDATLTVFGDTSSVPGSVSVAMSGTGR
jgi:Cep192 domain 4/Abnormal spindle-like microcephaly-assoc'd, ASPM-SPD-2-Hydin